MSLARWALRLSALEALRDQTLVGGNVRDSDFTALTFDPQTGVAMQAERPFVLIYTDDGRADATDARSLRQNGTIEFILEFGAATPMFDTDEATGETTITGVNIPLADAAMELMLDLLDRQIADVLTGPGAWADIWRSLSMSVGTIERRRTVQADQGIRLAARQIRMAIDVMPDPVKRQPFAPTSVWERLRVLIAADRPDLSAALGMFLGYQEVAVTPEMIRASRGLTEAAAEALGIMPFHAEAPGALIGEMQIDETVEVGSQDVSGA